MIEKSTVDRTLEFREARDWKQFHNPKNLAESVVIESSELLEVFQWIDSSSSEEYAIENRDKIADEVADILIYLIYLCDDLGIDLDEVIAKKLQKNEERYPQEKSKGNSKKYNELE